VKLEAKLCSVAQWEGGQILHAAPELGKPG
jgi:hypothetical protein